MILCKDCKWFRLRFMQSYRFGACNHPRNAAIDPTDGRIRRKYDYASTLRDSDSDCAKPAFWFQAK